MMDTNIEDGQDFLMANGDTVEQVGMHLGVDAGAHSWLEVAVSSFLFQLSPPVSGGVRRLVRRL